jgi:S1-C subfamily serine protease
MPAAAPAPVADPAPGRRTRPARGPRRLTSGLATLVVALAVLLGVAFGHAAWPSSGGPASAGTGASPAGPTAGSGFGPSGSGGSGGPAGNGYGAGGFAPGGSGGTSGATGNASATTSGAAAGLVDINTTLGYLGAEGAGTGIVLTADGKILTNNHVIAGASAISVTDVANGRTYKATVVGYDTTKDIALLQLQNATGLPTAKLGDSSKAAVGQSVVAIGNAGGTGGTPSGAPGTITALGRSIVAGSEFDGSSERLSNLIEVDANVQPGDSGGSLVNGAGEVIGVDTAASAGFSFRSQAGQGFAIPINDALALVKQIEAGQSSSTVHIGPTAFLGVLTSSSTGRFGRGTTSSSGGARISGVARGGAAQQAGLGAGDLITSLDGSRVDAPATLSKLIVGHVPGDRVELGWVDTDGQSHTTTVALGTGPPA